MSDQTNELVEHFFRHESANLVSVLARVFGFDQLPLVEDMVQSTLLQALNQWKVNGVPPAPAAWMHRVAKNKILDALRRGKTESRIFETLAASSDNVASAKSGHAIASGIESLFGEAAIQDSLLRMMFAVCHPTLDRHSQIALTLKLLCGFSVKEVASALLVSDESARKRIYRGKKLLADSNIPLEIPDGESLAPRTGGVHEVLYLMFNEGYHASNGKKTIREDVCEEASRLCHLMARNASVATTATKALLALMLYQAARFDARIAEDGSTVMLENQDRCRWDYRLIGHADHWLKQSAGDEITTFHLEAGICQLHCRAKDFSDTNWETIVRLYDRLVQIQPTPLYRLNRAIALGHHGDPRAGIAELQEIAGDPRMRHYHLLDCSLSHLYKMCGERDLAIASLKAALRRCGSKHEEALIQSKLNRLQCKEHD